MQARIDIHADVTRIAYQQLAQRRAGEPPAVCQLQLPARAYHRMLKLARTIADLAGVEQVRAEHIAEALQYPPRQVML